MITTAAASITGALIASLLACVPGLHVYNVIAALVLAAHSGLVHVPPEIAAPFVIGMTVSYAMLSTIPSVMLAAPDESAVFTVLPAQKYLMQGRGYEATIITFMGGLAGIVVLLLVIGPLAPAFVPVAMSVFRPHLHWIVWCVICFMLMSEWPKGGRFGPAGPAKLMDAWKSTGIGLLTFALSGILGFILMYRSPIPCGAAFQNLMPAFVGLFTVPWLILNIACRTELPPQQPRSVAGLAVSDFAHGSLAGSLGGGFAAFIPAVTGGVGAMLAGHATAMRNDRAFLVSQGTSRLVYYVGALLLFSLPGPEITRGGAAAMLAGICPARTHSDYFIALASIATAGAVCCLLVRPLTLAVIRIIASVGYRTISRTALLSALIIVVVMTGPQGLCVAVVSTGIGLLPVVFGSRRMNCLGIILLPMACNMSGIGPTVAAWMGLL